MKKIIALSSIAFLSTVTFASADMQTQIDELTAKIAKMEKTQKKLKKKVSNVNKLAAKDNIKWDVDFRTSVDQLTYTMADGTEYKNDALYANRLHLGMGYAPNDKILFRGQLSFNKAFGASYGQRGTGMGFDTFDWVVNENLTDDKVRLREGYWLYTDSIGDIGVTASVGRRPSTNGFLTNLRDDDKAKSPVGHVINMEFDGASASVKLDTYVPGMMFKICLGRGLSNAVGWASQATAEVAPAGGSTLPNYVEDPNNLDTIDMYGFIFKPYDDGQYSVITTWYRGTNVPGLVGTTLTDYDGDLTTQTDVAPTGFTMKSTGDMDGMALSLKVDGIGDGINDFLDETIFFASYAMSVSHPEKSVSKDIVDTSGTTLTTMSQTTMLGSADSETGTSYWIGTQMPNMTGGKFGLEYNHGDKYWKPFTFGEDTMIGSKLAARGSAIEAYWTQPLVDDVFSMQIRYTKIDYDYTGSGGFFGDGGMPIAIATAQAMGMNPVDSAEDLRLYFRYRY